MDNVPIVLDKGTLLVASPDIHGALFSKGVVLLVEHSLSGSFGVLINKAVEVELGDEMLSMEDLANKHIELRAGGPLQANQMMILHGPCEYAHQSVEILPGTFLGGDLDFLQKALNDENGPPIRLFFGYTGWPAGLLEREFLNGEWMACRGNSHYIFETPAEQIWRTVLREMGGKYATLSMIPDDLSLN